MEHALCILFLCWCFTLGSSTECPGEEWKRMGSSCFYFSEEVVTWNNARDYCERRLHATLAYILNAEENRFIEYRLNTYGYIHFYHIGATDQDREGRFVWVDSNRRMEYSNWSLGEPNSAGSEDCSEISTRTGTWNDIPCDEEQRFVCRIEL
ncbi:perlucin-like [Argopecten irradians]|uniref:perlucin-like n=1 Tax=Argopecten irradians TaxID=31199 RepID=UPI0037147434